VLGGIFPQASTTSVFPHASTASVEFLGHDAADEENVFQVMPPMSRGPLRVATAVAIDENVSDGGQVLLIGGWNETTFGTEPSSTLVVDLASGVCTPQPDLLYPHGRVTNCTAARLADGRVVCVGTGSGNLHGTAQILEPPVHGPTSVFGWQWRLLPGTTSGRNGCGACVLSDGRFAVFGGKGEAHNVTPSCEVLTLDGEEERWSPLPPMHTARSVFACQAIGGCVIVAGGSFGAPGVGYMGLATVEVYEEALGRWRRLPCDIPNGVEMRFMGSALM